MILLATVVFPDALPPARPGGCVWSVCVCVCVWRGRERKERRGREGEEREREEEGVCYYACVYVFSSVHLSVCLSFEYHMMDIFHRVYVFFV